MKKTAVISLSGGMDSTSLLVHLLDKVKNNEYTDIHALSFNYGQKHSLELERAKQNIEYLSDNGYVIFHKVIDLSNIMGLFNSALTSADIDVPEGFYAEDNMKATVVPNRNAIFSSIVYGFALSIATEHNTNVDICLGVHSGDHEIYPDCRPEFYDAINTAFALGNWDSEKVNYYLPYMEGDKYTILQDAEKSISSLKLDFNTIFVNTNTSYSPDVNGRASGRTGSDVERILAFHKLGKVDPIEYREPWDVVVENAIMLEKEYEQKHS
ncbi:MAG: 7-cyano-7-deazaguanine synthase [Pelagibacteraceae bacterium]|nr:7-cyano-7-deazaguanine synthase [Pelagibacteraceae bacterium]